LHRQLEQLVSTKLALVTAVRWAEALRCAASLGTRTAAQAVALERVWAKSHRVVLALHGAPCLDGTWLSDRLAQIATLEGHLQALQVQLQLS
jgi:hypothetical protein